jgi:hypothetical protein
VRGHADAETLAAFREELLSRRKGARVSAHLAACSRCAGLDAELTEVSALLTMSTAPPMPDALTARIEAAIAAEAADRAATAADGAVAAADGNVAVGAGGAGTGPRNSAARPAGGPGRPRLALRIAAVAAAVVVVAGGGYGVARLLSGSPAATTSAGSGGVAAPASRENSKAPAPPSGALRESAGQAATGGSPAQPPVVSSGTNYQPGHLEAQVSAVLTQHGEHAAASPGASPANQHAASALPVPACVPHVTGGKRPLLVDVAKYQGRPATIIVIPGTTPGTVRALVVAGACTATTARVLATATFAGSG